MVKKILLWSIILPLLLCVKGALSAPIETVNLGYVEFRPFTFTNDAGQADGIFIDKAKQILQKAGYQVKTMPLPTPRLRKYLQTGVIDIFLGVKKQGYLTEKLLFSTENVGSVQVQIFSVDNRKNIKIEELNHKQIITIRGFKYGGVIDYLENAENDITIFETINHKSAFEMLLGKRADYLLAYQYPASLILNKKAINNLSVSNVAILPVFFAANKSSSKGNADQLRKF